MKLLLSPHNDDESLFVAYTLIREKPTVLIITDSDMQLDRGDLRGAAKGRKQKGV